MADAQRRADFLARVLAVVIAQTIERRKAERADRRRKMTVVDGSGGAK